MRFENSKDLDRELKAIKIFANNHKCDYHKLGDNDIDFRLSKDGVVLSYVEVKGRLRGLDRAYPLPIAVRKLLKLADKKVNPIVIWSCDDGIIWSYVKDLKGTISYGGRKPRKGSHNDLELMAYYDKSNNFKTMYFND